MKTTMKSEVDPSFYIPCRYGNTTGNMYMWKKYTFQEQIIYWVRLNIGIDWWQTQYWPGPDVWL